MATKTTLKKTDFAYTGEFKCHFCKNCNGVACKNELPGMGGVDNNENFILNCGAWSDFYNAQSFEVRKKIDSIKIKSSQIGIAPVTGAMQNIGFENEQDFYFPYVKGALNSGFTVCIGDGAPDEKLLFGLEAVKLALIDKQLDLSRKMNSEGAYFFLKPYPNNILFKRVDLVKQYALGIGVDIDAYNIITMRNQVHLEKKSAEDLLALKEYSKLPLIIKGVFCDEDIELCQKVRPEIVVVSNHGGRIKTRTGSTLNFLKENASTLSTCCTEIWVDGGIRCKRDVKVALYLGAAKVLIARPFIAAVIKGKRLEVK